MKSRCHALLFTMFALVFTASARLQFSIVTDHADCLYRCGEEATFTVTVTESNNVRATSGEVRVRMDNFGPKEKGTYTFDLSKQNPFTVKGTLDAPGFLRLCLSGKNAKDLVWSVGYEPEKIEKGSPSPADFDAFWAEAMARLEREVPIDAQMTKIEERSTPEFDFYRVSFATFGRRVHGYLSIPKDTSRAPFPVSVQVAAAGFGNWTNNMGGRKDRINLFFAVYPFEPDWKWQEKKLKAKYDEMDAAYRKNYGTGYSCAGIADSRESYFFYPVILGINRAVNWLASRPDVDRQHFVYSGTSQGGGFGFYLCGLNKHFTKGTFFVPAITDTHGYLKGRMSGWPRIIESQPEQKKAAALKNAPYFDGANFAARIRIPVRVAVGFSDTTCPPCAVYAAFNAIPVTDKKMTHGFGMTHSCRGDIYNALGKWLEATSEKRQ